MKTSALMITPTLFRSTLLVAASVAFLRAESPSPAARVDPWIPLRAFIGEWEGDSLGESGKGKATRTYAFVLNKRFIQETNKSVYPPQEKNPKGEAHEHLSFFSYDKTTKKFRLRQFHIEGFVCEYETETVSEDGRTLVFFSGPIENFMPGWRGRETYRFLNENEFIETFALAGPGKEFTTYSETHFRRK
jgi:hypothetical protein